MKLYYLADVRMPNEKAHGIQIAKMCEAFIESGVDITLVLPRRKSIDQSIKDFYGLSVEIPTVVLPVIDLYDKGRFFYWFSALTFIISYIFYFSKTDKNEAVIYTIDVDHIAYLALPWLNISYFSEMHGGKPKTFLYKKFFSKIQGVIATNSITRNELIEKFKLPIESTILEPNGIDLRLFNSIQKLDARKKLNLTQSTPLALYVGRFFDWKGLEIIPQAANLLPQNITFGIVGGTKEQFVQLTKINNLPINLSFFGSQPYTSIPLWLSAADVLVVLGTRRDEQSWQYTSPMKLFEYMASKRPIVASKTPALTAILSDEECFFYDPDNAHSLAKTIEVTIDQAQADTNKLDSAYRHAMALSWQTRAIHIRSFINSRFNGRKTI